MLPKAVGSVRTDRYRPAQAAGVTAPAPVACVPVAPKRRPVFCESYLKGGEDEYTSEQFQDADSSGGTAFHQFGGIGGGRGFFPVGHLGRDGRLAVNNGWLESTRSASRTDTAIIRCGPPRKEAGSLPLGCPGGAACARQRCGVPCFPVLRDDRCFAPKPGQSLLAPGGAPLGAVAGRSSGQFGGLSNGLALTSSPERIAVGLIVGWFASGDGRGVPAGFRRRYAIAGPWKIPPALSFAPRNC